MTILFLLLSFVLLTNAITPVLILHGGAGTIDEDRAIQKKQGMVDAINTGYEVLLRSDNPLDAVESTVRKLENHPAFNAGYGSVLTETGEVEMDAIIINGTDLSAGAVGALRHVANPISLARMIKERTEHVFLVGEAAERYAASQGIPIVPTKDLIPPSSVSHPDIGTVGAVAINSQGQIAAATSTGGMTGKMEGRIGDTPIVGGGTLADDESCGISATGFGEAFIRFRVASKIASLIEQGENASEAILKVLNAMTARIPDTDGGAIVITKNGTLGYHWNSVQMAWAHAKDSVVTYGVNRGEEISVPWTNNTIPIIPEETTPNNGNANGVNIKIHRMFSGFSVFYLLLRVYQNY